MVHVAKLHLCPQAGNVSVSDKVRIRLQLIPRGAAVAQDQPRITLQQAPTAGGKRTFNDPTFMLTGSEHLAGSNETPAGVLKQGILGFTLVGHTHKWDSSNASLNEVAGYLLEFSC